MIFNKKKKNMVDLRELQKRGVVKIPKSEIHIPTNSEGFVELGRTSKKKESKKTQSNANFFGFMNSSQPKSQDSFETEQDGYNKREVDTKITNLDNKIYKLEQRLELLERKLDINQNNTGAMGW